MAKAHSTLKTTITKTRTVKLRPKLSLTVGYSLMADNLTPDRNSPLKDSGWKPSALLGQPVIIDVQQGLLIIRIEGLS